MRKILCQLIIMLLASHISMAQQGNRPMQINAASSAGNVSGICALDSSLTHFRKNAAYKKSEEKMNREILSYQRNLNDDTIVVPVVVHIINQDPLTVPDSAIANALKDLNDAYAKRGNYAGGNGVDTKIRFCLAQKDPDGGITTGITRTKSFFSTHLNPLIEDARLKKLVQWDPDQYVNIWYISSMDLESFANFSCGLWTRANGKGYATMPPGGDTLDGIVVTGFGNLLIHEMGHYLGLYHIFEGSNCVNDDCTTNGDRVCDTPPALSSNSSATCTSPDNSCNTDTLSNYSNGNFTGDVPDQVANFMNFGNVACQNQFTQGQADRMIATIHTQRSGLLQGKCDKPCNDNIKAVFTRSNPYPLPGNLVSFVNNSSGAVSYQWLLNDLVVSTARNFDYTFTATGKYKVSLKAFNTISCFAMYSDYVIVNCGVTARFYTDKRTIASKIPIYADTIIFKNTSENATSFQWMMSNDEGMTEQLISTSRDLVYVFPSPANYFVRLIATDGTCTDTTEMFVIPVADPTADGIPYMSAIDCYEKTKVRVSFFVCNYGYATIPANTPVSFYDADPRLGNANKLDFTFYLPDSIPGHCCGSLNTTIIDVHRPGLDVLYMVFNDSGNTKPLVLPNTPLVESNYGNNLLINKGIRFKASILPASATLTPGDTLQLIGQGSPGVVASYSWSPVLNLSCTQCSSPYLIADSDRVKRLVVTSRYGCVDTAYATIKVPPANDYTVDLNDVQCAAGDKLRIDFTISNSFKRGIIPKGLTVAFYEGDPATDSARLLPPVFSVKDSVFQKQVTFTNLIKGITGGQVYAVVNDSGTTLPVILPNNSYLPEKDYTNNRSELLYTPETVQIQPADTTVFRKTSFALRTNATIYNAASTKWSSGTGNTLSCGQCPDPVVTVLDHSTVTVQTENRYGCLIKGTAVIKIFPPDFTIKIIDTKCYSNSTSLVKFEVCMNNNYDSVFAGIPVSFYDALPSGESARQLLPVFFTPGAKGNCYTSEHVISSPSTGRIYAMVNDKGRSNAGDPARPFPETKADNNVDSRSIAAFNISIFPADTSIARSGNIQLVPRADGGSLSSFLWEPDASLSCTTCLAPVVKPLHTTSYMLIARNEYSCIDTAYSIVKTFTKGLINIPSAFSPNGDGLNDIFYILAGTEATLVKDLIVFNRWGEKVFEAKDIVPNDPRHGWNGTYKGVEAPPGAYVYIVRVNNADGKEQVYKGNIVLLR